jgi:hypothetical protein
VLFVFLCGAGWGAANMFVGSPTDFAGYTFSHARYDASSDGVVVDPSVGGSAPGGVLRGVVESPVIESSFPFDTGILSWNASTPKGSCVVAYLQARAGGVWSRWYKMALWTTDASLWQRTTFGGEKDSIGYANCSEMSLNKKADAIKIRVQLETTDGHTYPTLRFVGIHLSDSALSREEASPMQAAWGKDLDVPIMSQLSVPHGSVWCSATSVTMVLRYWGEQLHRPDLTNLGITEAAHGIVDGSFGGTGNWPFNTAWAGEHAGIRAYVLRLSNTSQIEEWIAKGVPVIVSLDYNKLKHRVGGTVGHLMVIRGFTGDGKPIFNDPWGDPKQLQKLKKEFTRADLEGAWLGEAGSYGTVYIIYPENYKL